MTKSLRKKVFFPGCLRTLTIAACIVSTHSYAFKPTDPGVQKMDSYLGSSPGGINAYVAWDVNFKGSPVTVAVIDTGYKVHPDFEQRILPGYDFSKNGNFVTVPLEHDGQVYLYPVMKNTTPVAGGIDPLPYRSGKEEGEWHGTEVAGIALAGSNSIGIVGINPSAKLLPVRVTDSGGRFAPNVAARGIKWAAGVEVVVDGVSYKNPNPARVINVSLGDDRAVPNQSGKIGCSDDYQEAINAARAAGAVIVVSAGNQMDDVRNWMPANCSGVVVVSAHITNGGDLETRSNYGDGITLSAPGTGIHSTTFDESSSPKPIATYESSTRLSNGLIGTSFSAPIVSGALSLMLSFRPSLSGDEAVSILKETAKPFPAGSNCAIKGCGAGAIDIGAAMKRLAEKYPSPVACGLSSSSTTVAAGQSTTLAISGTGLPAGAKAYWYGTKNGIADANGTDAVPAPGRYAYTNTAGMQGTYVRRAQIRDIQGHTICTTNDVTTTFLPAVPTCTLTGPSVVETGAAYTFRVTASNLTLEPGKTYSGYWYGTKNGIADANGLFDVAFGDHTFVNHPGYAGTYTRRLEIRAGVTQVCTTNTITTTLK